ncbi:transposase, partial [Candidatus Sumerlaeota bacterium]|nr:transposase [Candidatus Sumerlaeota bacterium]
MSENSLPWHHRPAHIFSPEIMYMVTAGTYQKEHFFKGKERLEFLQQSLFDAAEAYLWELQAWAIFPNHYHFIAKSPENSSSLKSMIQRLHSQTAREANRLDN